MATIKVFDCNGVKELQCFDTLSEVPYVEDDYLPEEGIFEPDEDPEGEE